MPIKIYVWLPRHDAVGHASMTLSDGTHISWWPSDKEVKKKSDVKSLIKSQANPSQNLNEDIYLEGNIPPDKTYTLDGPIKEDAISKWWASFRSNGYYRVFDQNCCHVVFKALEAGDAWKFITDEDVKSRGNTLLKPIDIDTLVKKLEKSLQDRRDKHR